ncbi:ribokinase [Nitratireductor aquimarinus]|uniref:ribokinase n=1 Tax=Alphaproteobacteria TaxID=28211 RepID=UPI0019D3B1C4|nr:MULTISPECIES: ribokinase [Alphaproteobacteria]MBN7758153.1 ribokinase [Nitratireductor aquimarinus]MBY6000914.1 ribokinase [Tritonibacter mobilis]MBY6022946.1 ribokinase [Nitratireductor sp. DP7N14-4]
MTSNSRTGRIVVVGSNMVDLITYVSRMPAPGETLEAPSFESGCGGKGANQAVAAAKLGSQVSMVSRVGDDLFGDNTLRNFSDHGIDIRHVAKVAGKSSGVAPIFVDESGENSILIVKGANEDLLPADVDAAEDVLRDADLILMQLEIPLETIYHTVRRAAEWGVPTILNPAPATSALSVSDLKSLSFLVPNESELALLSGMPTDTEEEIMAAARSLIEKGIGTVIVTLGSRGARLVTADRFTTIEPVSVTPVDTTGAGDAFIGSFAHFFAATGETETALNRAARYAAYSVGRRGTQKSYASADDFDAFCEALPQ